tara:strand:+ start:17 stop:5218 length:5202 start_codon:yes stop_codon:yes gene_type:complete
MPQETNLNVSPYFDDFNPESQYYKVLFKPGYPVQARELTTMQSILQNQIEQFGNHTFTEGSIVIPGGVSFRNDMDGVLLENTFQGISAEAFLPYLTNKTIKGQSSGVTAVIEKYISNFREGVDNTTIYVRYLSSGTEDGTQTRFSDGENLLLVEGETIEFAEDDNEVSTVNLQAGEAFATTLSQECNVVGSAVFLSEGVYFLRGTFVDVFKDELFLDEYSSTPSFKVGFRVYEEIVTSFEDPSLNDNSQGFSNYAAPGADRFQIYAQLVKLEIDSTDLDNFVELMEIRNGKLISIVNTPEYNVLSQEFARRTNDESGDYYVNAPVITAKNTLNNLKGNNGVFTENQKTYDNNTPNENLGTYAVSPMKAYVQGYEVETISPTYLDFEKPRTTKTLEDQSINYITGPTFKLNRVYGSPNVGIATTYTVSLRDRRVGVNQFSAPGEEIGIARVYDFALESGSYNTSNPAQNEWDIALYDIQTYTTIELNEPISLSVPTHIKGKSSGAVGFLRYDTTNNRQLTVYNTQGKFSLGEKFIFDGIDNSRVSTAVTSRGIGDVKAVHGVVGTSYTFTADTTQSTLTRIGQVNITGVSGGISTVTTSETLFVGIATVGNLVAFSNPGLTTNTFARITSVANDSLTLSGITTVIGICDGALPASDINPSDFKILTTRLESSTDNTLYTPLPKQNIASVDLTESNLTIRRQFEVTITSNSTGAVDAGTDETFLPFDEERYVLVREDGTTEALSSDKFVFTNGSQTVTINGLGSNGDAKLIATLRKINVKSKAKIKSRAQTIVIDKSKLSGSGIGATTLNDGLTYGNYAYGTRVQDTEIALLRPDVMKVYGVFESNDTNTPDLPSIVLTDLNGSTGKVNDLLIGEEFIGTTSNAIGSYIEKVNDLKISFTSENDTAFVEGEQVTFKESGITGFISALDDGDNDITSSFDLETNQRNTIYDQSYIVRKNNTKDPTRKLKIAFMSATFDSADTGDITTVNSYQQFDYCSIGSINGISNADMVDIRPRVSAPDVSENARSPFEFLSRTFTAQGNSASNVLASDESLLLTYSFYLPRIDKIFLTKDGVFQITPGKPAESPQVPIRSDGALEIATMTLPAYLCNINDVQTETKEHRRYRMIDIAKLEDRIKNLEYYTALSLLEVDTSSLLIQDANGLNRFKSGFFVDDFSTTDVQKKVTIVKNSIDIPNSEVRPTHHTTSIDLLLGTNSLVGIGTSVNPAADASTDTSLVGTNVKRTGQLVTLDYSEVATITQPYSTRVVNVQPYAATFYGGSLALYPSSDVWVDQTRIAAKTIEAEGNYNETARQLSEQGFDAQTGFGPVTWDSWQDVWTGSTKVKATRNKAGYKEEIETETKTGTSTRQGTRKIFKEDFAETSFGDRILNSQVIPFVRSRNVQFSAKGMKLFTRIYPFFDAVGMSDYVVPKLLEIEMLNGVFQVGETVCTFETNRKLLPGQSIQFRVAQQNHKYGAYNNPNKVFKNNPYDQNLTIPAAYSASSTILNVDTYSLANQPQGEFYGNVFNGMKLRGKTSGAIARITNVRLVTDGVGALIGSLYIPDPNLTQSPKFEAGTKLFQLINDENNTQIPGFVTTRSTEKYFVEGKINTVQENLILVRNMKLVDDSISESKSVTKTLDPVVLNRTKIPTPPRSYGGGGGSREYQGYAPGYAPATGQRGIINQNAGSLQSNTFAGGQAAVGLAGLNRALAAGYSMASVRAWAARTGAVVGPRARAAGF